MRTFNDLQENLEGLSEDSWRLLVLERDVTNDRARPVRAKTDMADTLKAYQMLSIQIFGQVRQDRQ